MGADPDALTRVLRGLVLEEVLAEAGEGRFALTELGEWLRADVAGSMRGGVLARGELYYRPRTRPGTWWPPTTSAGWAGWSTSAEATASCSGRSSNRPWTSGPCWWTSRRWSSRPAGGWPRTGFAVRRVVPTASPAGLSVIETAPAASR